VISFDDYRNYNATHESTDEEDSIMRALENGEGEKLGY
jgi:hypothetical protein